MSHRGATGSSPMAHAEEDVLACMTFPAQHRTKLHSTNPIERLNGEIKHRTDVVGVRASFGPVAVSPHFQMRHPFAAWWARY